MFFHPSDKNKLLDKSSDPSLNHLERKGWYKQYLLLLFTVFYYCDLGIFTKIKIRFV